MRYDTIEQETFNLSLQISTNVVFPKKMSVMRWQFVQTPSDHTCAVVKTVTVETEKCVEMSNILVMDRETSTDD